MLLCLRCLSQPLSLHTLYTPYTPSTHPLQTPTRLRRHLPCSTLAYKHRLFPARPRIPLHIFLHTRPHLAAHFHASATPSRDTSPHLPLLTLTPVSTPTCTFLVHLHTYPPPILLLQLLLLSSSKTRFMELLHLQGCGPCRSREM